MFNILKINGSIYRRMEIVGLLMILNFLFILTSIPLITIGTSITSVYSILFNIDKMSINHLIYKYFKSFKANLKKTLIISLFTFLLFIIQFINISNYPYFTGIFSLIVVSSILLFSVIMFFFTIIIYPYIAKFEDNILDSIKNSIKIIFDNIFFVVLMGIITASPLILMTVSAEVSLLVVYVFTFIGFSYIFYVKTRILGKIFNKYI